MVCFLYAKCCFGSFALGQMLLSPFDKEETEAQRSSIQGWTASITGTQAGWLHPFNYATLLPFLYVALFSSQSAFISFTCLNWGCNICVRCVCVHIIHYKTKLSALVDHT